MTNPVLFVSLGPGDPELITLKSLKALNKADIILCPSTRIRGGNISSRSRDIISALGVEQHKIILFDVPMSKHRSEAISCYNQTAEKIIEFCNQGLKVAVTAEGDSGFYSSAHYLSEILQSRNISVKKTEGIPAFIACGTLAGIHIAHQNEQLTVVPGVFTSKELKEYLCNGNPVVIMKASQSENEIKEAMSDTEDMVFHYFENTGITDKEFYTCNKNEIMERTFPYFSLLIIRK